MSDHLPPRPAPLRLQPPRLAMVASEYNPRWVDGLVESVKAELAVLAPDAEIALYRVPGAFEIPVVVQEVALRGGVEAVIALGVIIQGATAHADLVGRSVTDALQTIALKTRTPVIHEVLLVENEAQAEKRTTGEGLNRGTEAARAAVRVLETVRALRR
ncbi:MAG TPA: 6,7-dimethyl-8-ribityllumazine synthase [Chthoniobacteraceae bacterium]|nr:6,7-dimethyl-8-ribityllumazine synthase [Chthoniobacteraceae bacterium]